MVEPNQNVTTSFNLYAEGHNMMYLQALVHKQHTACLPLWNLHMLEVQLTLQRHGG